MAATGLCIFLIICIFLWPVTEVCAKPKERVSGVCEKLSVHGKCESVRGDNFCFPYCSDLKVGCQRQDTCKSVIHKSCLKEGCKLSENVKNLTHEIPCMKGIEVNSTNGTGLESLTGPFLELELDPDCIKDFRVEVAAHSFTVDEGSSLSLTCRHNLSMRTVCDFAWFRDGQLLANRNGSHLVLRKVFRKDAVEFHCGVLSSCGFIFSEKVSLSVTDNSLIMIVICGVAAVVVVLLLALGMKMVLRRESAERNTRRELGNNTEVQYYDNSVASW